MPAVSVSNWRKITWPRRQFTWGVFSAWCGNFFQAAGCFLLTSTKQFYQSNHLLLLKLIVSPKQLDCSLLAIQSVIQEIQQAKTFLTVASLIKNWLLPLFDLSAFLLIYQAKENSNKTRIWVSIPLENMVHFSWYVTLLNS